MKCSLLERFCIPGKNQISLGNIYTHVNYWFDSYDILLYPESLIT